MAMQPYCFTILQLPGLIPAHDTLNPLVGIQQIADGGVMVQGINYIGDVFAHIAVDIPAAFEQFRGLDRKSVV